ncbi:MAG: hypothetical protein VKP62_06640 [Candidatus Sericytochromatia bacterium]|nr:hypothetical protein [Candidatus Sericytochromatia bacterium]
MNANWTVAAIPLEPVAIACALLGLAACQLGWRKAPEAIPQAAPASARVSFATLVLLLPLLWLIFGEAERALPPVLGALLGAGMVWGWSERSRRGAPQAAIGYLGCGLLLWPIPVWLAVPPVAAANFAIGLVAGSLWHLLWERLTGLGNPLTGPVGVGSALAVWGAWGDRLGGASASVWASVATLAAVAVLMEGLRAHAPVALRRAAPLLLLGLAVCFLYGALRVPLVWCFALLAGAALGALGPRMLQAAAWRQPLAPAWALLWLGGLLLVVTSRLAGMQGVASAGLGLALTGAAGGLPGLLGAALGWLVATFSARVWLQLLLERTALDGYGVDLTHPYATAGLLAGALLVPLAVALLHRRTSTGARALGLALSALLPAGLGYWLHLEAVAACLMGLWASALALLAGPGEAPDEPAEALPLGHWLLLEVLAALLAAPWLVAVQHATRESRLTVAVSGMALLAFVALAWRLRQWAGGRGGAAA